MAMVIAGLVEQGETSAGQMPQFQCIEEKLQRGWRVPGKVPKALVHAWVIIRFLVPRGEGQFS